MPKLDQPTTVRLDSVLQRRLNDVVAASGGEYSRSEIICRAMTLYFAQLDAMPDMLPGYDPDVLESRIHTSSADYK